MQDYLTFAAAPHFAAKQQDLPRAADDRACSIGLETWIAAKSSVADLLVQQAIGAAISIEPARRWLEAMFGNSPFLTQLAVRDPAIVIDAMAKGPDHSFAEIVGRLNVDDANETRAQLMARLRRAKRHAALVIAMADLAGLWPLAQITGALSALAEASLKQVMRFVLRMAARNGDLALTEAADPEQGSGVIVLGMGKLGG